MIKRTIFNWMLVAVFLEILFPERAIAQSMGDGPSKQVRKEARLMEKEGWKPMPTTPPTVLQLHYSQQMQVEKIASGLPKYFMATATATAATIDQARMIASEYAQQEIIARVKAEVKSLSDYYMSIQQQGDSGATTRTRVEFETRVSATQRLKHTIPVIDLYRQGVDEKKEYLIRLACLVEELFDE